MTPMSSPAPVDARTMFANAWGILAFLLFMASLATAEYKYVCALLSVLLMGWLWLSGSRWVAARYPEEPKRGPLGFVLSRLPLWIGAACLLVLAFAPLLGGAPYKYLAFVQPLLGIRF